MTGQVSGRSNGNFRQRLIDGDTQIGMIVTLESPEVVEALCHIGFDWLFIDTEHAPLLPHSVQHIIQTAGETPCVVRLSRSDEISIKRALDAGAAGIIVPQVNSAAHARLIVSYAKYAPMGSRGIGLNRASMYGLNFDDYVAQANENTAIIVLAEHIDAVENIEDICDVEGVDAVFIGPYDLSASLNKIGRFDDREVIAAIDRVREVCVAKGLRLGMYGASPQAVNRHRDSGFTLLCCGADIAVFAEGARSLLGAVRGD